MGRWANGNKRELVVVRTDVVDWFKSMTVTSKRSINIFYKYILVQSVPDSDLERIDPPGRDAFDRPFPVGSNSENIPIG